MANKNFELVVINVESADYKEPKRTNPLVPQKQYDAIKRTCKKHVVYGTDGKVYIEQPAISKFYSCSKADGEYIFENKLSDKEKRNIGGKDYINSSAVVGDLDKRAQETRKPSIAAKVRYSRDSLISIGDSAKAEKLRRDFDEFSEKEMKKLREERKSNVDEITGDVLENGGEFHHYNKKSIYTDPEKAIDPNEGVVVNINTHKEIHRRNIVDKNQLENQKEDIKIKIKHK